MGEGGVRWGVSHEVSHTGAYTHTLEHCGHLFCVHQDWTSNPHRIISSMPRLFLCNGSRFGARLPPPICSHTCTHTPTLRKPNFQPLCHEIWPLVWPTHDIIISEQIVQNYFGLQSNQRNSITFSSVSSRNPHPTDLILHATTQTTTLEVSTWNNQVTSSWQI